MVTPVFIKDDLRGYNSDSESNQSKRKITSRMDLRLDIEASKVTFSPTNWKVDSNKSEREDTDFLADPSDQDVVKSRKTTHDSEQKKSEGEVSPKDSPKDSPFKLNFSRVKNTKTKKTSPNAKSKNASEESLSSTSPKKHSPRLVSSLLKSPRSSHSVKRRSSTDGLVRQISSLYLSDIGKCKPEKKELIQEEIETYLSSAICRFDADPLEGQKLDSDIGEEISTLIGHFFNKLREGEPIQYSYNDLSLVKESLVQTVFDKINTILAKKIMSHLYLLKNILTDVPKKSDGIVHDPTDFVEFFSTFVSLNEGTVCSPRLDVNKFLCLWDKDARTPRYKDIIISGFNRDLTKASSFLDRVRYWSSGDGYKEVRKIVDTLFGNELDRIQICANPFLITDTELEILAKIRDVTLDQVARTLMEGTSLNFTDFRINNVSISDQGITGSSNECRRQLFKIVLSSLYKNADLDGSIDVDTQVNKFLEYQSFMGENILRACSIGVYSLCDKYLRLLYPSFFYHPHAMRMLQGTSCYITLKSLEEFTVSTIKKYNLYKKIDTENIESYAIDGEHPKCSLTVGWKLEKTDPQLPWKAFISIVNISRGDSTSDEEWKLILGALKNYQYIGGNIARPLPQNVYLQYLVRAF